MAAEAAKGGSHRDDLLQAVQQTAADTSLRMGFVDADDPMYVKYRMQIQGELDDLTAWMGILRGDTKR